MATDPIGQDTYKGLAVPLYGESVIRQENSSVAALTIMHSTANSGRLLMGLDNKDIESDARSSVVTDLIVFDIDAEGGFRSVSGTTLKFEMNTSGLEKNTTVLINTSGHLANYVTQPVVAMTTGANYSPVSSQSGTLFTWGENDTSSGMVLLPKNPIPGTWFDFYMTSQDEAGDVRINCTANSSAKIFLPGLTSLVSSGDCIEPCSSIFSVFIKMTALSSVKWLARPSVGYVTAGSTDHKAAEVNCGHWTTGTTA